MSDFHRALADLLESGQLCATATLVDAVGSTPGKIGHRMIVLPDGTIRFTIGGGPLEAMVIAECRERIERRTNAVHEYRLIPEGDDAVGMVCGGTVRVFIEVHEPAVRLVVFGAGHVGREVIRMARHLGFRRVLADDRADVLRGGGIDAGVETVHCPDGFRGPLPAMDETTCVVIVTRCHATDREILARLSGVPVAYLGMIGSLRKVASVLGHLEERGLARAQFAHLRAPIGLEIGARSPAEIALAILAEIVAVRNAPDAARRLPRAKVSRRAGG